MGGSGEYVKGKIEQERGRVKEEDGLGRRRVGRVSKSRMWQEQTGR